MMRIVCPNCGEEPQKGQRHLCRPKLAPEAPAKPSPIRSNRVPCATAGSMCASIASLASKNPGLWKSKRSLARSGGDDFVAALLFLAAEHESWTKNSKQALLFSLNLVANEAAMALQRFWRSRCRTKEIISISVTTAAVNGYTAKAATHHGSFRTRRPEPQAPQVSQRKSNPRPVQSRAVPVNPLQAMKLRTAQQQQEAEERRILGRQEAEEARQARKPEAPGARAAPVLPEAVDENLLFTPPTTQSSMEALLANLAAQTEREQQDMQDSTADSTPKVDGRSSDAGESMLTPLELRKLRSEAAAPEGQAVSEKSPAQQGSGPLVETVSASAAATERLRDRLRRRESGKSEPRTVARTEAATSQVNWKERIELRHKEAEEQQVQEKEEKQRTAERSTKRSDALRRVLERREQRQQDCIGLQEE